MWVSLMHVAPLRAYSRLVRWAGSIRLPRPARPLVFGPIARRLGIDLAEAELPLVDYPCFRELFVRRLRPEARSPCPGPLAVVSPVDGCLTVTGVLEGGSLLQAKGRHYSAAELLDDSELAQELEGGAFATLYLRPRDYHRVHVPLGGTLESLRRIPGGVFPVQPSLVRNVADLFCKNERAVFVFSTTLGRLAVVCIAASGVSDISTVVDDGRPQPGFQRLRLEMTKGEELAAFNLGSTVILIFAPGRVALEPLAPPAEVRVGQVLGRALQQPASPP